VIVLPSFRVWSFQSFSAAFRVALPWRRIKPRTLYGATGVTLIEKLHHDTKALESDMLSRQCYSKRRTEKLKTPDVQTEALGTQQNLPGVS